MKKNRTIKIFTIALLVCTLLTICKVEANEFTSSYISPVFISYPDAKSAALLRTSISVNSPSNAFLNPATGNNLENTFVSFSHFSMFDDMYTSNILAVGMPATEKMNFYVALDWVDYGKYYDTRSMIWDAIYIDGQPTSDSTMYWDYDGVIERRANDFIFKFALNRMLRTDLSVGALVNLLYRDIETARYVGTSVDLGLLWNRGESLNVSTVLRNFGAAGIKRLRSEEISYQPMHVEVGLEYRLFIRNRRDSYISALVSHNSLFLNNRSLTLGAVARINKHFEIFGSYSLDSRLSNEIIENNQKSVGLAVYPQKLGLKVSQTWDDYNMLGRQFSINFAF